MLFIPWKVHQLLSLILYCLGGLAPVFLYLKFRAMWLDVVYYNASRVKSYVWDPFQQHKNLANRLYWTVFFQGLLRESITLFAHLYSSGYKLLCKRLLQCNMHKTFKRHVIITMQAIRFLNMINFMHFVRFVSLHNFFAFYTWYEINLTFNQLLLPRDDFVAEISLLVIPGADFALKFNYSMHKLRKTYFSPG